MIESKDLTLPESIVEIYEHDAVCLSKDAGAVPTCVMCGAALEFSEDASELIGIRRLCTVPQVVFDCPECCCPLVMLARGSSPSEERNGDLVFHQPEGGWWIGRLS